MSNRKIILSLQNINVTYDLISVINLVNLFVMSL